MGCEAYARSRARLALPWAARLRRSRPRASGLRAGARSRGREGGGRRRRRRARGAGCSALSLTSCASASRTPFSGSLTVTPLSRCRSQRRPATSTAARICAGDRPARVRRSARNGCAVSLAPPPTMNGSLAKRDSSSGTISVPVRSMTKTSPSRCQSAKGFRSAISIDERARIEFPHAGALDPGKLRRAASARRATSKEIERAGELELFEDGDLGRFLVAGDLARPRCRSRRRRGANRRARPIWPPTTSA